MREQRNVGEFGEWSSVLRARATLDAHDYVALAKQKNPKLLKLQADGTILVDFNFCDHILASAFEYLHIGANNPEAKTAYLIILEEEIRKIVKKAGN